MHFASQLPWDKLDCWSGWLLWPHSATVLLFSLYHVNVRKRKLWLTWSMTAPAVHKGAQL